MFLFSHQISDWSDNTFDNYIMAWLYWDWYLAPSISPSPLCPTDPITYRLATSTHFSEAAAIKHSLVPQEW